MNQCQFKTRNGTQCRHHTRSEFPVLFSPKLGIFLCSQHEKIVITDHIKQFLDAQLEQSDRYEPFSFDICRKFINISIISHIPEYMERNQCLFKFTYHLNPYGRHILYHIQNNFENGIDNIIQINSYYNEPIIIRYKDRTLSDIPKEHHIQTLDERYRDNIQIMSYVPDTEINQRHIQELISYHTTETNPQTNINTNNADNIVYHYNFNEIIENNTIIITQQQPEQDLQFDIIEIDYCYICCNEEKHQKGIEMKCCNTDNKVCIRCLCNEYINQYNKYYSLDTLQDYRIFETTTQNCFFCRNKNKYKKMCEDKDCKDIFIELLKNKLIYETILRINRQIETITQQ